MTQTELDNYLEIHSGTIEWSKDGEQAFLFRDVTLPWYQESNTRATRIDNQRLFNQEFTPEQLHHEIRRGLDVEGITRITGYFSKTRAWNPGKRGELNERERTAIND